MISAGNVWEISMEIQTFMWKLTASLKKRGITTEEFARGLMDAVGALRNLDSRESITDKYQQRPDGML